MPRPSQADERRRQLLPIVAKTFAELGYRRTTTAELAKRCKVRENILYRLWRDKKAMFVASIEFVYALSAETWRRLLAERGDGKPPAERLLQYESEHHGESGLQRLVFAGLSETNDPAIRRALRTMYRRFHRFIGEQISDYRDGDRRRRPDIEASAWAVIGLGTLASIVQELDLLKRSGRRRFMADVGHVLIEGRTAT
ncbi:MAG: TetR/AcrR family transcriptional regulator [Phycisphaerales bacterium]|nr:TetR/AcrR family transcriptional regulator [Phycisphaerales bacterium]